MSIVFETSVTSYSVSYNSALQSNYIKDLVQYTGEVSIITIPDKFLDVINNYVRFLNNDQKDIYDNRYLTKCFDMFTYFDDKQYFTYLVNKLFDRWTSLSTVIVHLDPILQYDIYLQSPYDVIPQSYLDNIKFFSTWLDTNKTTNLVLDKNVIYHRTIIGDDNILLLFHTINGKQVGEKTYIGFYHDGQLNYKFQIQDGKGHVGYHSTWYQNTNNTNNDYRQLLKFENHFDNDKLEGIQRSWYDDENSYHILRCENYYENGSMEGVQREWYNNTYHTLKFKHKYKNGQKHGLQLSWYDNSQHSLSSEIYFENGKLQGLQKSWYDNEQHTLKYEGYYVNGERPGPQKKWNENGQLIIDISM